MAIANTPQAGTGLSRRAFVKTVTLLICGVLVGAGLNPARAASQEAPRDIPASLPSSARDPRKLNVLFIMTDQHNARALGCYGNNEVRTPNMDRLAAGGVLFERAFCQTGQCVPSRYSIFTGRYARSHGTYSNGQTQNPQEQTVAEMFKAAGYATATIGKHHMVMGAATQNHGFDLVFNAPGKGLTRDGTFLPYDEVHPGRAPVGKTALSNDDHPAGVIATEAIKFLRAHRDKPFVLWYSFSGPHTPICPSAPWADWYDPDKLTLPPSVNSVDRDMPGVEDFLAKSGKYSEDRYHRQTLAYYYGLVSQIDHNIGRVLDELDALGLADNTIVVYTADHGEMMAEHGAWTKGRTGYEATLRVPLILRLPKVLPAGKRVSDLVCSIDLLPTLLDAAGMQIPENVQGMSLLPTALGEAGNPREYVFSELGGSAQNTCITIRSKTHKYVLFRSQGKTEYEQFFDLIADPWEMKNEVANPSFEPPLRFLKDALRKWEQDTPTVSPQVAAGSGAAAEEEGAQSQRRPARGTRQRPVRK